jgi:hypothetical protein
VFRDEPFHCEHGTSCQAHKHILSPLLKNASLALSEHKSKLAIAPYELSGLDGVGCKQATVNINKMMVYVTLYWAVICNFYNG